MKMTGFSDVDIVELLNAIDSTCFPLTFRGMVITIRSTLLTTCHQVLLVQVDVTI